MKIESNPLNAFSEDFAQFDVIGFHATSSLACTQIESAGFLPSKIFLPEEHEQILSIGGSLGVNLFSYKEWLDMRSITFTQDFNTARSHILQGNSGGQGLFNVVNVLQEIRKIGDSQQVSIASNFLSKVDELRSSSCVIYAVDLSRLGQRLVRDKNQPGLYQVYFDPQAPLPKVSVVDPHCIIARLDLV